MDKVEYKRVNFSMTDNHLAKLDQLANRRTFSRSLMIRTLIDDAWKREQSDQREEKK